MRRVFAVVLAFVVAFSQTPQIFAAGAKTSGSITGIAQSSSGQVLRAQTVQLRDVRTGSIVGSASTTAAGSFTFDGLLPGQYVVEIVEATGKIVGASSITSVLEDRNASVLVTAASTALVGGAIGTPLLILLIAAAGAGAVGVYEATKSEASPSR
jgi:hypothetical protein